MFTGEDPQIMVCPAVSTLFQTNGTKYRSLSYKIKIGMGKVKMQKATALNLFSLIDNFMFHLLSQERVPHKIGMSTNAAHQ